MLNTCSQFKAEIMDITYKVEGENWDHLRPDVNYLFKDFLFFNVTPPKVFKGNFASVCVCLLALRSSPQTYLIKSCSWSQTCRNIHLLQTHRLCPPFSLDMERFHSGRYLKSSWRPRVSRKTLTQRKVTEKSSPPTSPWKFNSHGAPIKTNILRWILTANFNNNQVWSIDRSRRLNLSCVCFLGVFHCSLGLQANHSLWNWYGWDIFLERLALLGLCAWIPVQSLWWLDIELYFITEQYHLFLFRELCWQYCYCILNFAWSAY